MITITQIENKNIYLFKITDNVDESGTKKFIDFLTEKAENNEKIKMIGEMKSLPGFKNFKTFVETMKMKFKAISVVEKYAVLTDKSWIETIVPVGDFFIPGMEIKQFDLNERDAAIEWLETSTN